MGKDVALGGSPIKGEDPSLGKSRQRKKKAMGRGKKMDWRRVFLGTIDAFFKEALRGEKSKRGFVKKWWLLKRRAF